MLNASTFIEQDKIIIQVNPAWSSLIAKFLERTRQSLKQVTDFLEKQDFEAIWNVGHNWHGTGSSFGFEQVTAIGRITEQAARDHEATKVLGCVEDLENYLNRVEIVYTSNL